jgi:hypothetical protein
MLVVPARGEQFDNPDYKNWARFKPGSMVSIRHVEAEVKLEWVRVGDKLVSKEVANTRQERTAEKTRTLIEINADKAVIEIKQWKILDGKRVEMPGEREEVPARLSKAPAERVNEPDEQVSVGDKKIQCKVASSTTMHASTSTLVRTWTNAAVPGGVVRFVGCLTTSTSKIRIAEDVAEMLVK